MTSELARLPKPISLEFTAIGRRDENFQNNKCIKSLTVLNSNDIFSESCIFLTAVLTIYILIQTPPF
jgi:hypothetical protein